MVTKDLLKNEIENVKEEYLDALYKIIKGLEHKRPAQSESWDDFIGATYGCLADDPIKRGEQGQYELRGVVE